MSDPLPPPVPNDLVETLFSMEDSESIPMEQEPEVAAPLENLTAGSIPPPPKAPDPYLGTTIDGRYRVESTLGEGGMGVVYAGRHKVINKKVAIKILRGEMSHDREMTERFLQEARAASSIGHPNIIDISDFGTLPDGAAYFVMEFLEGRSLVAAMNETKPMPLKRLLHVARQVADGLQAAHSQQIVHRDLKPDNIFLIDRGSEKDFIKILDFGIAKVATGNTRLTRAGTVFGTPHYMSPEQAAGAPVDHRTDIYALGVIMYEMASGRVPFDADNYMGILTQHMYKAPVPIRVLVPPPSSDIPPGLEAIILKALSKKPEHRYQQMSEVVEDLTRLEQGEMPLAVSEMMARSGAFNVPADYFKSALSDVLPATPPEQRKPWGIIAGVAGVLAAVVIVAVILSRGNETAAQTTPSATAVMTSSSASTPIPTETSSAAAIPPPEEKKEVLLSAIPTDAEIFLEGKSLGKSPVAIQVPNGKTVSVEFRRSGYIDKTVELAGSPAKQTISLDREKVVPIKGGKPLGTTAKPPGKSTSSGIKSGGGDIVDPWGRK